MTSRVGAPGAFSGAAAHLVGVQPIVTDHLHPFIRNVLGEHGQKVDGIKDLEVAVNFGV